MSDLSDQDLLEHAVQARERSYSPYSEYAVGAALLSESGVVYEGANIENASYGLSTCAERVAVFKAVYAGERSFATIAIAGADGVRCSPCGACRQVLFEFAPELDVIMGTGVDGYDKAVLRDLLPRGFGFSP